MYNVQRRTADTGEQRSVFAGGVKTVTREGKYTKIDLHGCKEQCEKRKYKK